MLQIVKGDLEALKAEMKRFAKDIKDEIKSIKKKHKEDMKRKGIKDTRLPSELQELIERLETSLVYYSPSVVLPVRLGELIINYKAYQVYVKSLKDVPFDEVATDTLKIIHKKGYLDLNDLSDQFKTFKCLPMVELRNASKA